MEKLKELILMNCLNFIKYYKKMEKKIDTRFPNGENNKDVNIRVKNLLENYYYCITKIRLTSV